MRNVAFLVGLLCLLIWPHRVDAFCLFNCSPSAEDAKGAVTAIIQKGLNQPTPFEIIEITKTDSRTSTNPERHLFVYRAVVEIKGDIVLRKTFACEPLPLNYCNEGIFFSQFVPREAWMNQQTIRPGRVTVNGSVVFMKYDSGWKYAPGVGM
jgi:hypothetical protein